MTVASRIAFALARRFPELNAAAMVRHPAFRQAIAGALAVADEESVVEQVVALGGLAGATNPHAVVVSRIRGLPALVEDRRRMAGDAAEAARWAAVDRAVRRGETLRALVERGDIYADEARSMLAQDFADDGLRAIAAAALGGGAA
jgi:hypothetical protein